MKYKVGEVANLLGLTTSAIHFYEKEGVIKTKKEENGHRYYELEDLIKLIQCKESRNRQVPLKDIIEAFQDHTYDHNMMIRNQLKQKYIVEQQIEFLQHIRDDLDDYVKRLDLMPNMIGNFNLELCEAVLFKGDAAGRIIDEDHLGNEVTKQWITHVPFTKIGVLYDFECLNKGKPKATLGLIVNMEEADRLRLPRYAGVVEIQKQLCFHTVIECKSFFEKQEECLNTVITKLKKLKIKPEGLAHGVILFHDNDEKETNTYIELWIHLK
ncbi:predicted transcriptional regulators [Lachnospiraceae bacterium KM106-2]|nr:predicted transcriptional regulators [Lachnospiraceae bacterium KM106-2]